MLGAGCSLEMSEMVLTEHKNPEEGMASTSLKDASSSGVSMETVRMESRPNSEVFNCMVQRANGIILTPWFKWEVG